MKIRIHAHASQRMRERGATTAQIRRTVTLGNATPAKFGRTRFRLTVTDHSMWLGKAYHHKQIDAFAAKITGGWLVITVVVKYF